MSALLDGVNVKWMIRVRDEDMQHRALEHERHLIENTRRLVDEKTEQLKAVASLSALIGGFAVVFFVELEVGRLALSAVR